MEEIMEEEKPGISGSLLKLIAVVTMLIDHIGVVVIEAGILHGWDEYEFSLVMATPRGEFWMAMDRYLRMIGRVSFPIFCFLLVEGFCHTRDVKKYMKRLLCFSVISEVPFDYALYQTAYHPGLQNVFFTLAIGLAVLIGLKRYEKSTVKQIAVFSLGCLTAWILKTDYDVWGILLITTLYLYQDSRKQQVLYGGVVAFLESMGAYGTAVLAMVPIYFYNGERGKLRLKYFFYWFYPVHLVLLALFRMWRYPF